VGLQDEKPECTASYSGTQSENPALDGTTTAHRGGVNLPTNSEAADDNDVMREQLEYLINHTAEREICGCFECQRYLRVRAALLEIFSETQPVGKVAATVSIAANIAKRRTAGRSV
jgi:hypothetical protein